MRTITVKVTQEHIDKGNPLIPSSCPLALGLRASGYPSAVVGGDDWSTDYSSLVNYKLGKKAESFRRDFDRGKPVRPASFRLQAPDAAPGAERTKL